MIIFYNIHLRLLPARPRGLRRFGCFAISGVIFLTLPANVNEPWRRPVPIIPLRGIYGKGLVK